MSIDDQVKEARGEFKENVTRGPQRLRWDELPPQAGDVAPDVELTDTDGNARRLSEFWNDRSALLLFWRHQGCSCGFDRAARLKTEFDDYVSAGANVVMIGQGEPERARAYAEANEIKATVLCDPNYEAYRAFGVREGQTSQIVYDAPEPFWHGDRNAWEEFEESRAGSERALVDNPWQLPAEFVVAPGGELRLTYHYNYCENYPDPRVLITAIKTQPGWSLK